MSISRKKLRPVITDFQDLVRTISRSETFDKEVLRSELSDQIDLLMTAQKVSKAELARKLGKSRAYVTKILQGNANFTLDTLVQIGRALECKYVPMFVPVNVWKQIEAFQASASTTVETGDFAESYIPDTSDEIAA